MNVASGYGVATSNYGGYNAGKTSQTSNKPFTIPIEELIDEKPTQTQSKVSSNKGTGGLGVLTFVGERGYSPFRDIAETGNVNFPKLMQTKTTPTRSDEEILKELEELAKEHARTGEFQGGDRYFELLDEYVSSVSPDRASTLKSAATEIYERLNPQSDSDYSMSTAFQQIDTQRTYETEEYKEKEKEKELLDYFLEALKNKGKPKGSSGATSTITRNGNCYTETIDYGGGRTTSLHYVNGEFSGMTMEGNNYSVGGIDNGSSAVTYSEFYDDNGEKTMYYNGNKDGFGLRQVYTKEEGNRLQEVLSTYNAAYDVAVGRHSPSGSKSAYNSTYERLTSGSVA